MLEILSRCPVSGRLPTRDAILATLGPVMTPDDGGCEIDHRRCGDRGLGDGGRQWGMGNGSLNAKIAKGSKREWDGYAEVEEVAEGAKKRGMGGCHAYAASKTRFMHVFDSGRTCSSCV